MVSVLPPRHQGKAPLFSWPVLFLFCVPETNLFSHASLQACRRSKQKPERAGSKSVSNGQAALKSDSKHSKHNKRASALGDGKAKLSEWDLVECQVCSSTHDGEAMVLCDVCGKLLSDVL
jgi:hypothetical protein